MPATCEGEEDDFLIRLTRSMTKKIAIACLHILEKHKLLMLEMQEKWPGGHVPVDNDSMVDFLLLVQLLKKFKNRNEPGFSDSDQT